MGGFQQQGPGAIYKRVDWPRISEGLAQRVKISSIQTDMRRSQFLTQQSQLCFIAPGEYHFNAFGG